MVGVSAEFWSLEGWIRSTTLETCVIRMDCLEHVPCVSWHLLLVFEHPFRELSIPVSIENQPPPLADDETLPPRGLEAMWCDQFRRGYRRGSVQLQISPHWLGTQ